MKPGEINVDSLLTSHQVAVLLQVNPSSVNNWIKNGRIHAFRTPGGHHRIRAGDLIAFAHEHDMPLPRSLAHAGRRRLLVVADDVEQLAVLETQLARFGDRVSVRSASTGIDGLIELGSFAPDILLLDLVMPDIDGLEVCARLRARAAPTRVIVATARLTPKVEADARAAGASGCLAKPVELAAILEALEIPTTATVGEE